MYRVRLARPRHPAVVAVLATLALAVGVVLVVFGLALVAALVAVASVGSLGLAVWRRAAGRRPALSPWTKGAPLRVVEAPVARLPKG